MRTPILGILGLAASGLAVVGFTMAPADVENGWKGLRSDDGDQLRWHACTVEYAVDLDGAPESATEEVDAAIQDTEEASGLDFQEAPWNQADLKITVAPHRRGSRVAVTERTVVGDEQVSATISVFPKAFSYPKYIREDNYRHELGHVLGLDHIDSSDTMSSKVTMHPTQTGWKAGLEYLYQGCQ